MIYSYKQICFTSKFIQSSLRTYLYEQMRKMWLNSCYLNLRTSDHAYVGTDDLYLFTLVVFNYHSYHSKSCFPWNHGGDQNCYSILRWYFLYVLLLFFIFLKFQKITFLIPYIVFFPIRYDFGKIYYDMWSYNQIVRKTENLLCVTWDSL